MEAMSKWLAPVLGVAGIVLAIVLGCNLNWSALKYADNMLAEAVKVAGALFVIAVFLERALAVVNDLLFAEEANDHETLFQVALSEVPLNEQSVAEAQWELRVHEEKRQALRLGIGFVVAVLIASAGVRTFAGLLDIGPLGGAQRTLLNVMDILLTAGLLAGGSNGIAKIMDVVRIRASLAKMRALREAVLGSAAAGTNDEARRLRAGLHAFRNDAGRSRTVDDGVAGWERPSACEEGQSFHASDAEAFLTVADLNLADHAKSAAEKLKKDFPAVVFTSGRRTVSGQASAMAGNIVKNRQWIVQTYASSIERDALQSWVDVHPEARTAPAIAAGLAAIMEGWTDAQRVKLSRHFAGLAFDVQPTSDANLKAAIRALPHLVKFLESEGGLTIWHAEFSAK